jgi:hypothetical protein
MLLTGEWVKTRSDPLAEDALDAGEILSTPQFASPPQPKSSSVPRAAGVLVVYKS